MNGRIEIKSHGPKGVSFRLYIDKKRITQVSLSPKLEKKHEKRFRLETLGVDSTKILSVLSFEEFYSAGVVELGLRNWKRLGDFFVSAIFRPTQFLIVLDADTVNFTGPNSFKHYYDSLYDALMLERLPGLIDVSEIEQRFILTFRTDFRRVMSKSLDRVARERFQPLLYLHSEILDRIKLPNNENQLFASFEFPTQVRVACIQYLHYFAQFLADLNISAIPEVKERAGKVLFSVTPTGEIQALDKIREALSVYLNLPSSPIVFDESFAAMRLQQQIDNLHHSQTLAAREIQLAQKVIESQDKVIQQKDSTIDQQSKIIDRITNNSIMIDSAENKEELEKICEGLQIGQSKFLKEQLGIHVNPATVIKTIGKSILGKQENTSIIPREDG